MKGRFMKMQALVNAALGILTEIIYALFILMAGLAVCALLSFRL